MLPEAQRALCLSCHGTRTALDRRVAAGVVSAAARPALLAGVLSKPFLHPVREQSYSDREPGVTCTSCHSPHRGGRDPRRGLEPPGRRRLSPKDPTQFEYQLCESCHGNRGRATGSLSDISRLLSPTNRSYHPVEAAAPGTSPSVVPRLSGREINCTDCHGPDEAGQEGPHASGVPALLRAGHATLDGAPESPTTYALCYLCHQRESVLAATSPFPGHDRHVVELKASCATCHNPHGSVANRALVRFGEETLVAGVAPSVKTGRLAFVSDGPHSGACYLTCHGRDHAPETYGRAMGFPPGSALRPARPVR